MPSVCAVVRAPAGAPLPVVHAQRRAPDDVVVHEGTWHDAVAAGATRGADWLWLVDGEVEPQPDALAELLGVLDASGDLPDPVLLASRVLDAQGDLDPRSEPWTPLLERVVMIAAARRGLVALRLARWGSLLVRADGVERHGPPRADFAGGADDMEWTVRLLRDEPGYLVPRSVARSRRAPGAALGLREVRDRLRMVRGEGWIAHEAAWFAFILAVDAARAAGRLAARAAP